LMGIGTDYIIPIKGIIVKSIPTDAEISSKSAGCSISKSIKDQPG